MSEIIIIIIIPLKAGAYLKLYSQFLCVCVFTIEMKRIKKWECKYINALVSTCFSLSGSNCHVQLVHALFTMLFCKKKTTIFGNFQLNDGNICWQAIVCPTRSVMNFKWTKSLVFSWKMAKFKNNFILNLELPMSLASETGTHDHDNLWETIRKTKYPIWKK